MGYAEVAETLDGVVVNKKEAEAGAAESKTKVTRSILFVTSEAAPYSKTGGLGDVCGSLPIALAGRGHRVMVVSPMYVHGTPNKKFENIKDLGVRVKINCFGGTHEVAFFHEYRAGVDWVRISLAHVLNSSFSEISLCNRKL